ncbi:MAG TPA: MATE family efflux transporter [Polyangia bacterium]|nr:MATE family efflux transporter [Polyangia bacterium]
MKDLTSGSITRNILATFGFMFVSMLFQTLYFLVDLYFVGRLGKEAVAAVSVAGNLTFVVLAATQMVAVGTTSLVAQATGRKDGEGARLIFNQSQGLSLAVGALFFLVFWAVRVPYARAQTADAPTARLAIQYLDWFIPAMALQFTIAATAAGLRGTGNFAPGMVVQTVTVVLNMVLAPVLMFGWGTGHPLGVAGTALASFLALALGAAALTIYVARGEGYLQFRVRDMRPQPPLWRRMLVIGLPAGAEFFLMAIYMLIVYKLTRPFGAAAQAGFGIGLRVVQGLFLPVVALGFAVSPVAGQNFGARKPDRVRATFKMGALMASGLMAVFTILCHLIPGPMVRVFSKDPQVLAVGSEYLRIISSNFIASGLIFVSSSMFQALGNTIPPLISSALRLVIVAVPAYLLSRHSGFQLRWIWYLSAAAVIVQVLSNLLLLRREYGRRLQFPVEREVALR